MLRLCTPNTADQRRRAAGYRATTEAPSAASACSAARSFLRIQALGEATTGVTQRIGLEPWGRLRVTYQGLVPDAPLVADWALRLGVPPGLLADGIASLLDRLRRTLHVLDRHAGIFSRYWQEGDRYIQNGYLPRLPGVPKGLKLRRAGEDDEGRVTQWLSERGDTIVRQVLRKWGWPADRVEGAAADLWRFLVDAGILAPVTLRGANDRALPRCAGTYQIDADLLRLEPHRGVWRCRQCRRIQSRPSPFDRCLAWRCDGTLVLEEEQADNYDLSVLDDGAHMVRPREHSAQVPAGCAPCQSATWTWPTSRISPTRRSTDSSCRSPCSGTTWGGTRAGTRTDEDRESCICAEECTPGW